MVIPLHALCRDRSTECRTYAPCKLASNQRIKLQQDYCCIEIVICRFSYVFLYYIFLFFIIFCGKYKQLHGEFISLLYL